MLHWIREKSQIFSIILLCLYFFSQKQKNTKFYSMITGEELSTDEKWEEFREITKIMREMEEEDP